VTAVNQALALGYVLGISPNQLKVRPIGFLFLTVLVLMLAVAMRVQEWYRPDISVSDVYWRLLVFFSRRVTGLHHEGKVR